LIESICPICNSKIIKHGEWTSICFGCQRYGEVHTQDGKLFLRYFMFSLYGGINVAHYVQTQETSVFSDDHNFRLIFTVDHIIPFINEKHFFNKIKTMITFS